MIKFCHIAPTQYIERLSKNSGAHLLLAHLVDAGGYYLRYYQDLKDGKPKILDNSAFELFQRGDDMYSIEHLVELAKLVDADYVVMPDYPNEVGQKTIDTAIRSIEVLNSAGFKTFFVPQSKCRDLEDYLNTFEWALRNKQIDLIGVSIIGAPNAFGALSNDVQRILSRWRILTMLEDRGALDHRIAYKRLHFLGLLDGPREILLVEKHHNYINSWDSSGPVWFGLNGGLYDESPTGQESGKFTLEVDFNHSVEDSTRIEYAVQNIDYVSRLLGD